MFLSYVCGCFTSSAVIDPKLEENEECSVCYEKIFLNNRIQCTHPTTPHTYCLGCIEGYSSKHCEGNPVPCPMRCGHVFGNILGKKNSSDDDLDAGPSLQLNWELLESRIAEAFRSGNLRSSRSARIYIDELERRNG